MPPGFLSLLAHMLHQKKMLNDVLKTTLSHSGSWLIIKMYVCDSKAQSICIERTFIFTTIKSVPGTSANN